MADIGLRLPDGSYGYALEEIVETVQTAEGHGYHSVWYPEGNGRDVFMVLGHIAIRTDRIRLAPGITPVYARVPAQLAMAAATLDELSEGRAMLGLGASSSITVENWYGIEYDQPLRRIRETIEIVNLAMANDRVDYDGKLFQVNNYPRDFSPVQESIPMFNAALGETNRRLTGEYADGWLPVNIPFEKLPTFVGDVRDAAANAGRDPKDVTIAPYIITCVSEDRERARDHVRGLLAYYIGAMEYYAGVFRRFGFEDQVDDIHGPWQDGDRDTAHDNVSDDLIDSVAIAGTPDEGRQRLREYCDQGVDIPIVYPPQAPKDLIETTITELASY